MPTVRHVPKDMHAPVSQILPGSPANLDVIDSAFESHMDQRLNFHNVRTALSLRRRQMRGVHCASSF